MNARGPRAKEGQDGRVIQRMKLQNINPAKGHKKFYQVDVCFDKTGDMYRIEATWGRIGNVGTYMVKAQGQNLDDVLDDMEKVLLQKLFKRGYEMIDIQRWPTEARSGDGDRFIDEDWD
jgi:predicted DNA-binding WGR domain protein